MPDHQTDYQRIAAAIRFLEENYQSQPDLAQVAAYLGLSDYHFQRLFTRWAGISPKKFVQFLTLNHAKQLLAASQSVLDATYAVGLSSPGRLHDLFVTYEALTPGNYKQRGAGLTITYGLTTSPFGNCLIALTDRGICALRFVAEGEMATAVSQLQAEWPQAAWVADNGRVASLAPRIFTTPTQPDADLRLYVSGTPFQLKVWQALLTIPPGQVAAYGTIARLLGDKNASRAVGTAVGHNPIAYLIPCHRVIRQNGGFGQYRWGSTRKKAILAWEAAQKQAMVEEG